MSISTLTRLEALVQGAPVPADAPCCPFHATGGHPDDRHGFDPASVVYRLPLVGPTRERALEALAAGALP